MSIHEAARAGFQAGADAYERGRPDYPRPAIARLVKELGLLPAGSPASGLVLDLGAGTGKFTRLLAEETGAKVLAVEPVAAMRSKLSELAREVPSRIEVTEGTAERIPLPDGSVDAAFAAQAFHWFNGPATLRELWRVLKPGGGIGLIWNRRDESVDWIAELTRIIDPHEKGTPRYRTGDWRKAFDDRSPSSPGASLTPLGHAEFPHSQSGPPEMVVDRIASISFISALPADEHASVRAQVRALLEATPGTRGKNSVDLAYITDIFWCKKFGQPELARTR